MRIDFCGLRGYLPTPIQFDPAVCIFLSQANLLLDFHRTQEVRVWDLASHACLSSIDLTAYRDSWADWVPIAASEKRRQLLVGAPDGIHIFDLSTATPIFHLETPQRTGDKINPGQVTSLSLDGYENTLAVADQNQDVFFVDMNTRQLTRSIDVGIFNARPRLSADGSMTAANHGYGSLGIWSTETGEEIFNLGQEYLPEKPVDWVFSKNGSHLVLLVSGPKSPHLRFLNLEAGDFETPFFDPTRFTYTGLRDNAGWIFREFGCPLLYRLSLGDLRLQPLDEEQQAAYPILLENEHHYATSFLQTWTAPPEALIRLGLFLTKRHTVAAPLPCQWFSVSENRAFYGAHRLHVTDLNHPDEPPRSNVFHEKVDAVQSTGNTAAAFVGEALKTINPITCETRKTFNRHVSPMSLGAPKCFLLDRDGQNLWYTPNSTKQELVCHDVASGRPRYLLSGFKYDLEALSHAYRGQRLYGICSTQLIGWNLSNQSVLFTQQDKHSLNALTCNNSGTDIYTTSCALIHHRDAASGEIIRSWDTRIWGEYKGIMLNLEETRIYAWSHNGDVVVLNLGEPHDLVQIRAHCGKVLNLWPVENGFYSAGEHDGFLSFWEPPYDTPRHSWLFFANGQLHIEEGEVSVYSDAPYPQFEAETAPSKEPIKKICLGQETLSKQHKKELVSFQTFMSQYKKFSDGHGLIYHMNHENANIAGFFNHARLDLGIQFNGESFSAIFQQFETEMANLQHMGFDMHEPRPDMAEVMASLPGGRDVLLTMEAFCHEVYHLWQTLTLQACRQYTTAIRRLIHAKHHFMNLLLRQNGSWKHRPGSSIFEPVLDLGEKDFKAFYGMVRFYTYDFEVVDLGRTPDKGLCAMDLIEGAAFCAQKLAFNSWDVETIPLQANPMYHRAFKEFQAADGRTPRLFMLLAQTALKHGELTDFGLRQRRPTPVQVFRFLLEHLNLAQEEMRLSTIVFSPTIQKFSWFAMLPRPVQQAYHTSTGSFQRFCQIVKTHFELTWDDFNPAKDGRIDTDPRLETMFREMNRRIPDVVTDGFGIAMLHHPGLIHQMQQHAMTMNEWEIPREDGASTTLATDLQAADFLEDLVLLAESTKLPYCCPDHDPITHGSLQRSHIFECLHPDGLNQFTKTLLNRPLRDIIT